MLQKIYYVDKRSCYGDVLSNKMSLRKVKFFENDSVKVRPGELEENFVVEFKEKIGSATAIIQGLPFAFRECGIRWGNRIRITMAVRDSQTWFDGQEIEFVT